MRRVITLFALLGMCSASAGAQGVLGDVLAGKLVNPKVGQWAWYDLLDSETGRKFLLRQAIVGKEKVGRKTGYWLEIEIAPEIGPAAIYKMLVTGPASNRKNIHKLIVKQGTNPPREIAIETALAGPADSLEVTRESKGDVTLRTAKGELEAEHVLVTDGASKIQLWLNDDVRPMGIVQMKAPNGALYLRDYGEGGQNAVSKAVPRADDGRPTELRVQTDVEGGHEESAPSVQND